MFGKFGKGRDRTKKLEMLANAPIGAGTSVNGRRGVIKGTLLLSEDGDRWIEHLVEHQDGERLWVAVENFDRTRATLWSDVARCGTSRAVPTTSRSPTTASRSGATRAARCRTPRRARSICCVRHDRLRRLQRTRQHAHRVRTVRRGGAGRRRRATSGLCPNCHAPLHADAANKCSSCGSDLMADHGHWGSWEVALGVDVTDSAGLQ
ncbi:MAG: hypothetical protein R2710_00735 [Acidimicrobiales bacterium]